MAELQLNFNLDNEDDRDLFELYQCSRRMYCFIYDYSNVLRSKYKYGSESLSEAQYELIEDLYQQWADLLQDHDLSSRF